MLTARMNISRFLSNFFKQQMKSTISKTSIIDSGSQMKLSHVTCQRSFSILNNEGINKSTKSLNPDQCRLLVPIQPSHTPVRTYKAKGVLELRCKGCFFEKREGRLYVECTLKPRHRQMKKIATHKLFRDEYSKGKVAEGVWWQYRKDRYYRQGKSMFANYNWLGDRLGKDI